MHLISRWCWCCLQHERGSLSFPGLWLPSCLCSAIVSSSLFLHPVAVTGMDLQGRNCLGQAAAQSCCLGFHLEVWGESIKQDRLSSVAVTNILPYCNNTQNFHTGCYRFTLDQLRSQVLSVLLGEPRSSEQALFSMLLPWAPTWWERTRQTQHHLLNPLFTFHWSPASKGWHGRVSHTEWQLQVNQHGRRHYGHFQYALKLSPTVVSHDQCLHSSHVP